MEAVTTEEWCHDCGRALGENDDFCIVEPDYPALLEYSPSGMPIVTLGEITLCEECRRLRRVRADVFALSALPVDLGAVDCDALQPAQTRLRRQLTATTTRTEHIVATAEWFAAVRAALSDDHPYVHTLAQDELVRFCDRTTGMGLTD
jgi:hypothetical protein